MGSEEELVDGFGINGSVPEAGSGGLGEADLGSGEVGIGGAVCRED